MKKCVCIFMMLLAVLCSSCSNSSFAEGKVAPISNVQYPDEVTHEMVSSNYWSKLRKAPDTVLLTIEEIGKINEAIVADGQTNHVVDLEQVTNIEKAEIEAFDRELFVDGKLIDEKAWIQEMQESTEALSQYLYAVTIKRANIRSWPTQEFLGYTENDPDDELQNSALEANSPVVISEKCNFHDQLFYYCQSEFITGWINSEELAICHSREEWLDSWKVNSSAQDFLVVTQDWITLEPMLYEPEISEMQLGLGTKLKLVPESELPDAVGEREGTLFNYVVYVPTRDEAGEYVRKVALIPERYHVSIGYLPFTERNLTSVAFELLGNRYGWGGMMKSYDSSMYSRQIYSCFGFKIPTNTTWQKSIPGYATDISEMTEEEKVKYLKVLPLGSILYIPGGSMQYIGCVDDLPYVIADLGVFSNSQGVLNTRRYYTVSILPLSTRRRSGETFLASLNYVLNFAK